MFLQVGVFPQDRPWLRFLWQEDPTNVTTAYQYVHHCFGAKDLPTCTIYALKRNAIGNETLFPEAALCVKNIFYKDDYLESSPTVKEAKWKAQDLVKVLVKGVLTLTKFVSNVCSVLLTINRMENPTNGNVKSLLAEDESSQVLEVKWNNRPNMSVVRPGTSPEHSHTITQRVIPSLVSTVYDPIGLFAPYAVESQLFLKRSWRFSVQEWDDNLSNHIVDIFLE